MIVLCESFRDWYEDNYEKVEAFQQKQMKTKFTQMLIELKKHNIAWFEYRKNTNMYYDHMAGDFWAKDEIIELYRKTIVDIKLQEDWENGKMG